MTIDTKIGPVYGDGFWSEPQVGVDQQYWSEQVATFSDYRYHLKYGSTHTMGPSETSFHAGINYEGMEDNWKFLYHHHDAQFNYTPTVVGNDLDNTITSASNHEALEYGFKAPSMTIYGGGGDDTIITQESIDRISGGSGDDWIHSGAGADQIYGGTGNDMLLSGSINGQSGHEVMYGGSGADTFVLGDGTSAATPSQMGMIEWNNPYTADQQTGHDIFEAASSIPKIGSVFKATNSLLDYLNGTGEAATKANAYSATTVLAQSNAAVIGDFDPTEDMIVIPLSNDDWGPTGSKSLSISTDGINANEAFRIYSDGSEIGADTGTSQKLIASVSWDDLSASMPEYVSSALNSPEVMTAFKNSVIDNMLVIDGEAGTVSNYGRGDSVTIEDLGLNDYGQNFMDNVSGSSTKVLVLGASIGTFQTGSSRADYLFGGNMDDVIYGYNADDSTAASSAGTDHMYGFEGDDLFISGAGVNNSIYGGDDSAGSDTVAYYDAVGGVNVDLSKTLLATTGGTNFEYAKATATYADDNQGVDYLYDIENIIGSSGNDTIFGDAGANQLASGAGGVNILTGGAGADTFIFSGGETTVTDYAAEDNLVFDAEGSFGVNGEAVTSTEMLTFNTVDGDTTISLASTGESVAHIQNATVTADDVRVVTSNLNPIYGTAAADTLNGTSAADVIRTGQGNDHVYAGAGADVLINDAGHDYLSGEDGADTFVFVGGSASVMDYEDDDTLAISMEGEFNGVVTSTDDLSFNYADGGTTITVTATGQEIADVWAEDYSQVVLHADDVMIVDDASFFA